MFFSVGYSLVLLSALSQYASSQSQGDIRLSGTKLKHLGRVEIYFRGKWGTVCDRNYGGAANTICHQLNYTSSTDHSGNSVKLMNKDNASGLQIENVTDNIPIQIRDVECGAIYSTPLATIHVLRCDYESVEDDTECSHDDDLAVCCDPSPPDNVTLGTYDTEIMLLGGDFFSAGILVMYLKKKWGNICYEGFQNATADTACRQLGYTHSERVFKTNKTEDGVVIGGFSCRRSSSCLSECFDKDKLNEIPCSNGSFVGLQCGFDLNLVNKTVSGNAILCSPQKHYSKTPTYFFAIMSTSGFLWLVSTVAVIVAATCYSVKKCPCYKLGKRDSFSHHTIN